MLQQFILFSRIAFIGTVFFITALYLTVMMASWDGVLKFLFGVA